MRSVKAWWAGLLCVLLAVCAGGAVRACSGESGSGLSPGPKDVWLIEAEGVEPQAGQLHSTPGWPVIEGHWICTSSEVVDGRRVFEFKQYDPAETTWYGRLLPFLGTHSEVVLHAESLSTYVETSEVRSAEGEEWRRYERK